MALVVSASGALFVATACAEAALEVRDVHVAESVNGSTMAVYARMEGGAEDDTLVALEPGFDAVGSLHVMSHQGDLMTMRETQTIAIGARSTVELRSGAMHGMLERMASLPAVGDTVRLVFVFASGAEIEVHAPIVSFAQLAGGADGHRDEPD